MHTHQKLIRCLHQLRSLRTLGILQPPEMRRRREMPDERPQVSPPERPPKLRQRPSPLEEVGPQRVSYSTSSEDSVVEAPDSPMLISDSSFHASEIWDS